MSLSNNSRLIPLIEYAAAHKKAMRSVQDMARRGRFKTARKIGRNWVIEEGEPYPTPQRTGPKKL